MPEGSDILNKLKGNETFIVPEGYFESFPEQMLQKVKAEPATSKVISVPFAKRIVRYAAAAVVAGLIATGAWLWINKPDTTDIKNGNDISKAEKDVLQKVQNLSDSEIVDYIENSALSFTGEKTIASADIQEEDAKLLLADVSDEELQQYLDNGSKNLLN